MLVNGTDLAGGGSHVTNPSLQDPVARSMSHRRKQDLTQTGNWGQEPVLVQNVADTTWPAALRLFRHAINLGWPSRVRVDNVVAGMLYSHGHELLDSGDPSLGRIVVERVLREES